MMGTLSLVIAAGSSAAAVKVLAQSTHPGKRLTKREPLVDSTKQPSAGASERVGRHLRRIARRPADSEADKEIGRTVILAGIILLIQPMLALLLLVVLRAQSVLRRRRRSRDRAAEISDGLAEVIDLFAIALLTGTTVGAATRQVGRWAGGEFGAAFGWCEAQVAQGRVLADTLELLPERLGSQVRPLTAALAATERYGAPIAQSLMQLGADSRADRRRRAEAAARRLPVALLFPLVLCILPAFLLLTVVPVVAESFARFDLFGDL